MRMELLPPGRVDLAGDQISRDVGAAVVRPGRNGGVVLDLGPADGPAHLRITLSAAEAKRLCSTLQGVANGGSEQVLIVDEGS